ncbi:MAG: hypothetical protein I8H75_05500 [Myxococcaceae bacterium]|nr:hypothetical protein [Myxococcaceae bacterium]MBH2006771.1 hypothetical protein [Myxococcaceae bacterium]
MNSLQIISKISEPTFTAMITACSRKVRDTLYARMGIKAAGNSVLLQLGKKQEDQARRLHERFKKSSSEAEIQVCQEIIRNWLYTQRPMLQATLDYLQVPNEQGLVETEPDFFKNLSKEEARELYDHVASQFNPEYVWIYLSFVEVPSLAEFHS